ncbi:MAG: hypothetical protein WCD89_09060 [Anaerocolumna sp.]
MVKRLKDKINITKLVKICGNAMTVIAFLYIIQKMINMGIDYSKILTKNNISIIIVLCVMYAICVCASSIPWKMLIEIIVQKRLSCKTVSYVYCKSNIYKYVPGNVFQYVGRNEIAVNYSLKHADIILATGMDVLMTLISIGMLSIAFYYDGVLRWFKQINLLKGPIIFIFLIAVILLIILFRNKITGLIKVLKNFSKNENILQLFLCILLYMLIGFIYGIIYFIVIKTVLDNNIDNSLFRTIIGGYLISWIAGYITPGAPGGIGIREVTISFVLSGVLDPELSMLGIIIYRLISIVGDLLAYAFTNLIQKNKNILNIPL